MFPQRCLRLPEVRAQELGQVVSMEMPGLSDGSQVHLAELRLGVRSLSNTAVDWAITDQSYSFSCLKQILGFSNISIYYTQGWNGGGQRKPNPLLDP